MSFHNGFVRKAISAISALAISSVPCLAGEHMDEIDKAFKGFYFNNFYSSSAKYFMPKILEKMGLQSLNEALGLEAGDNYEAKISFGVYHPSSRFRYPCIRVSFIRGDSGQYLNFRADIEKIGRFIDLLVDEIVNSCGISKDEAIVRRNQIPGDCRGEGRECAEYRIAKKEVLGKCKSFAPIVELSFEGWEKKDRGDVLCFYSTLNNLFRGNYFPCGFLVRKGGSYCRFLTVYNNSQKEFGAIFESDVVTEYDTRFAFARLVKEVNPGLFKEWLDEGVMPYPESRFERFDYCLRCYCGPSFRFCPNGTLALS